MKNFAINSGVLGLLVLLMAFVGPALDDNSAENIAAKQELASKHQQDRFERAAQEVCGPNAAFRLTQRQGEVICMTKRGHKTKVAQL